MRIDRARGSRIAFGQNDSNLLSILVDEMRLSLSPDGLSGTFAGSFLLYEGSDNNWPSISNACFSESHSVRLTRRSPR